MAGTLRKLNALDFSTLMWQSAKLENLDSLRVVTNGEPMSLMGMASSLFAQRHAGIVLEENAKLLAMARAIQWQDEDFAQLQFITSIDSKDINVASVIETLLKELGAWGITRVMGDLPANSVYLPDFRKANFIIWASHRYYNMKMDQNETPNESSWRTWSAKDYADMQSIYQTLVPARIRSYEPMTRSKVLGKVLRDPRGNVIAYVDLDYGSKSVWGQLFFLPEAARPKILEDLAKELFAEYGRPVTFSARSYMPWLRSALDQFGAEVSEERGLIARHLAVKDQTPETITDKLFEKNAAGSGAFTIQPDAKS
jgi:hypothetical protein